MHLVRFSSHPALQVGTKTNLFAFLYICLQMTKCYAVVFCVNSYVTRSTCSATF